MNPEWNRLVIIHGDKSVPPDSTLLPREIDESDSSVPSGDTALWNVVLDTISVASSVAPDNIAVALVITPETHGYILPICFA